MIDTLRSRFILSHLLPLALVVPVMGIALVYALETGVILPTLTGDLRGEAALIAELTQEYPEIWTEPEHAQALVTRVSQDISSRIVLLDAQGLILASSEPADAALVGKLLPHDGLGAVLQGTPSIHMDYSRVLHAEIADVFIPVRGPDHRVVGVVRTSQTFATAQQRFLTLRYLVFAVLVAGLLLGILMSLLLAANLERPLRQVTRAIDEISGGQQSTALEERGPAEIRRLLHAVNTLVERLNKLEQSQRQMLANLVHELGRPIAALRSAVQALARGACDDADLRLELLDGMDDEMERLQHLLDDLARLHDQVFGLLKVDRRPTDLVEWLPRVLVPWREAAQGKGLDWTTDVPDSLPTVDVDPDRLASVVGNLLSNAIKYTPSGGRVSVEAGVRGDRLWIRVGDTGAGIPPVEQSRIFNPFYRGSAAGRFPQGMGLGLSLARDMVEAHGGTIELDSAPGAGSRFTVLLPLVLRLS